MSELLLRTVHGSHLYGLNHAGSDEDYYEVITSDVPRKKNLHTIVDGIDTTQVTFSGFFEMCYLGVPQALEALYSTKATVDKLSYFRDAFRPGRSTLTEYAHAMTQCIRQGDYKRRRHALRLALNLRSLMTYGYFNPTLTPEECAMISDIANRTKAEYLTAIRELSPLIGVE